MLPTITHFTPKALAEKLSLAALHLCHQAWSLLACYDKARQSLTLSWFILDAYVSITALIGGGKAENLHCKDKEQMPQ